MFSEVGNVPLLHGDHGVVVGSQSFFGADGLNPFVDNSLVGNAQLIEILVAHSAGD
jgi:hypothetical protein